MGQEEKAASKGNEAKTEDRGRGKSSLTGKMENVEISDKVFSCFERIYTTCPFLAQHEI